MDIDAACKILGVDTSISREELEAIKRRLLQAIHPDKHPPEQRAIFTRLARDIIEAAEFLETSGALDSHNDVLIEQILFDETELRSWNRRMPSQTKNLIKYEKRYSSDSVLAVAVLGIDYRYSWRTTPNPLFDRGEPQTCSGCALHLLVMNRTHKGIENLLIGHDSFLIDDKGFQYSPSDTRFFWASDSGKFNAHSDFLAPNSKIDGFILFPQLRKGSCEFVRWFLRRRFQVGGELYKGNYDVFLS